MKPRLTRVLIPLGLVAGALTLSLIRLGEEGYNPDEGRWIIQGQRSWELLIVGDFDHPFWSETDLYYGRESPAVAKYLIGMTLQLCGQSVGQTGEAPAPGVLWGGRLSSALMGAIGVLAFYGIAQRVAGRSVAVLGSVLLSTSPIWLPATRRAMVDIHACVLGLATVYSFLRADEVLSSGRGFSKTISWLLLTGILAGLAVGAKFNAAGVPLFLGLLLLARLAGPLGSRRGRGRPTRALTILLGGVLFAVAALATFVAMYPYLHEDIVSRIRGILEAWRYVRTAHVEFGRGSFAGSYYPGWYGFTELMSTLLFPGRMATGLLLLPLAGATATWLSPLRNLEGARRHVMIWSLAAPAVAAGLLESSRIVHHWFFWVSLVGSLAVALSRGGFSLPRGVERARLLIPTVVFLGSLCITLATTYITWPRYYLHLIPWLCLFAALGIVRLGVALVQLDLQWVKTFVVLSAVLGCSTVLGAYPSPGTTKMARIVEARWTSPPRILSTLSAASFCAFPLVAWLRSSRAGRNDRFRRSE